MLNLWLGHIEKRFRSLHLGIFVSLGRTVSSSALPLMYYFLAHIGKLEFDSVFYFAGGLLPIALFLRGLQGSQFASVNQTCFPGGTARLILWLNIFFGCFEAIALLVVFLVVTVSFVLAGENVSLYSTYFFASIMISAISLITLVRMRLCYINFRVTKQFVGLFFNACQMLLALLVAAKPEIGALGLSFPLIMLGYIWYLISKTDKITFF